jgi:hypothetical protein
MVLAGIKNGMLSIFELNMPLQAKDFYKKVPNLSK